MEDVRETPSKAMSTFDARGKSSHGPRCRGSMVAGLARGHSDSPRSPKTQGNLVLCQGVPLAKVEVLIFEQKESEGLVAGTSFGRIFCISWQSGFLLADSSLQERSPAPLDASGLAFQPLFGGILPRLGAFWAALGPLMEGS